MVKEFYIYYKNTVEFIRNKIELIRLATKKQNKKMEIEANSVQAQDKNQRGNRQFLSKTYMFYDQKMD